MKTNLSVRSAIAFTAVAIVLVGVYRWVKKTFDSKESSITKARERSTKALEKRLSGYKKSVLKLKKKGLLNTDIARKLGIDENHVRQLLEKAK